MAALAGEPWRGAARASVFVTATPANNHQAWVSFDVNAAAPAGDQTTWTGNPGTSLTLRFRWVSNGTGSGQQAPTFATVQARLPGGAQIGTDWTVTFPAASTEVTQTFHFDNDPTNGSLGTNREGMVELYLNWGSTGGALPWSQDSRGTTSGIIATNTAEWARGKARAPVTLSAFSISDASLGGAEPALFGGAVATFNRATLDSIWYRGAALLFKHRQSAADVRSSDADTPTDTAVQRNYTWNATATGVTSKGRVNKDYALSASAVDARLVLPSNVFGGTNSDLEYVWAVTTPDTSGNGRNGTLVGSVAPTFSASGMTLDGVDRDDQTSGVNCGVTGFGVSTADGSCQVKATIRRSRTGVLEGIAGKFQNVVTGAAENYFLYVDATGKLSFGVTNGAGTAITAVGTTSLASATNYDVEGNWTGTVLNVKVGGVQEGTTPALTALTAPDATTPFTIGRFTFNSGDASSPFPFQGTISNVSMTRGGVVQGLYALTSTSVGVTGWSASDNSTATSAARFTADPRMTFAQLLQLNDSTFGSPPLSKNNAAGQRQTSDLAFLASRVTNANSLQINSVVWTEKLWDTGNLISSEASPWKSRSSTSQAQGGENGWSDALMTWDAGLPGGAWSQKEIITTADLVGAEVSNTRSLTLLAKNPNFAVLVGGGTNNGLIGALTHWKPGNPLILGAAILNTITKQYVTPDASRVPYIIIGQFNLATGQGLYLRASDLTFQLLSGATADSFLMSASAGDANVFLKTFTGAQTAAWAGYDLQYVIVLYNNGTPYAQRGTTQAFGTANPHSGYAIDPILLALGGKLGTR